MTNTKTYKANKTISTKIASAICILCILTFSFSASDSYAQNIELGFQGGSSYYIGEIENPYVNALAPSKENYSFTSFARVHVKPGFALRMNISFAKVFATDNNSSEASRFYRNLHFRSDIVEASLVAEQDLLSFQFGNNKKKANSLMAKQNKKTLALRGFLGAGIMKFNPQAELNGTWYDLQKMGTEGQGIKSTEFEEYVDDRYELTSVVIPMGLGLDYTFSNGIKLGLELGYRMTFTDYLDDVSGTYVNPALISGENSSIAAQLSNRTQEITQDQSIINNYQDGMKRGNSNTNDAYLFTSFSVSKMF